MWVPLMYVLNVYYCPTTVLLYLVVLCPGRTVVINPERSPDNSPDRSKVLLAGTCTKYM
jgi:hypothetical protein